MFLIFDIEAVFLFPRAVNFYGLGFVGFIEVSIFILLLFAALLYALKKGMLRWLQMVSTKKDDRELNRPVFLTRTENILEPLEKFANWGRYSLLWPLSFGLACCAIEMMATAAAKNDIARFGMEVYRASPRQADLMIVSGTVTHKMAPRVKRLYDQMHEEVLIIYSINRWHG